MWSIPAVPASNALHPLVVHFPIALLMVVPVFLLLAIVWKAHGRAMLASGAVLAVMAAAAAFVAGATGEAAEEGMPMSAQAKLVLEDHEELGEAARNATVAAAGVLALLAAIAWKPLPGMKLVPRAVAGGLVIAAYFVPMVIMANAAHQGGRLVHEFGVRSPMPGSPDPPATVPNHDDEEDD